MHLLIEWTVVISGITHHRVSFAFLDPASSGFIGRNPTDDRVDSLKVHDRVLGDLSVL